MTGTHSHTCAVLFILYLMYICFELSSIHSKDYEDLKHTNHLSILKLSWNDTGTEIHQNFLKLKKNKNIIKIHSKM